MKKKLIFETKKSYEHLYTLGEEKQLYPNKDFIIKIKLE